FSAELGQKTDEIQKRLWADLERIRLDYERLIFSELKTIRQRALLAPATAAPVQPAPPMELPFDYGRFAERFRGTEEYVKANQELYRPISNGKSRALDLGCGRGELLAIMPALGVSAKGTDRSDATIGLCTHK